MTYGYYDRPPLKEKYTTTWGENLAFPMARSCQYQKDDKYADPGCVGCVHKTSFSGNTLDLFEGPQATDTKHST